MNAAKVQNFVKKVIAARYLAISAVIHIILVIFLFGIVVYEVVQRTQEFQPTGYITGDGIGGSEPPPPPPSMTADTPEMQTDVPVFNQDVPMNELLMVDSGVNTFTLSMPVPVMPPPDAVRATASAATAVSPTASLSGISNQRAAQIRSFTGDWFQGNRPSGGRIGTRGPPIEFPIYVGRTESPGSGAFVRVNPQGLVIGGSIPNLAEMIRFQSRGRITPRIQGEMIRLSSDEVFKKKPPFIYITGRGDFRLTDAEINNMREYLMMGGCIWGDAALPGRGSRFDIAFRREMQRIIGEGSKFTPISPNHPVYRGEFVQLSGPPPGINHLRNPVEVLKIDNIEAVIYTTNGYGAMWQVMLQERDFNQIDTSVMINTEREFWNRRATIFRNVDEKTLLATYQFGLNMVAYLLIRFEDALRFAR